MIWQVADAVWTGLGDTSTGFYLYVKRTILSGVIASTLAVWRKSESDEAEWSAFLDRRIADVMAFEKVQGRVSTAVCEPHDCDPGRVSGERLFR